MEQQRTDDPNIGRVVAVRGSVIDAHFPERLPEMHTRLDAGPEGRVVIEVALHLDDETVRGVALTRTQGLARGDVVRDTGGPIRVPVGRATLGRVFNVLGEPIDNKPLPDAVERRAIHRTPVALREQSTRREVLDITAGFEALQASTKPADTGADADASL